MNQHNLFIKLLDTGLPATRSVFLHRQPRPLFCDPQSADLLPVIYPRSLTQKLHLWTPSRVLCFVCCKPWLDI